MTLKSVFAAAVAAALCSTMAFAAEPQEVRQQMMKETGAAFGALGAIAKGQKPYDEATVKASLEKLAAVAKDFPNHFPKGSETGFETEASIKIWEDPAGFKADADKLEAAVQTAMATPPTDQAGVAAAVGAIGPNCGACHQAFRLKR